MLPLVREGPERNEHSTSRDIRLEPQAAGTLAAGSDIRLAIDTELLEPARSQTASNVGEPSCAINGKTVLYTGNWYAAVSVDGGASFRFVDPARSFPDPSLTSKFCCDQVAIFLPQIDTFVWLLQYGPDTGDNVQRLAFAKTADVAAGRWRLFDITTRDLGVPGAFLDFPDLAVGSDHLYVTTNIFGPGQRFGTAVVRIPIEGIRTGNVRAQPFVTFELNSGLRVAQNCAGEAFFAAHANTSTLAVFRWAPDQARPVRTDVPVARWIGGNGYISRTPDGRRWLDRADSRLTGATLAAGQLWFAWGVDRRSNHRAQPFVQIARIDASSMQLIEDVNVFDAQSATAYAALATNRNSEVGISYMLGGGPRFPTHIVGILTGTRKDFLVAAGERGPLDATGKGEWGDYLSVRPVFPNRVLFAATGFTMKGAGDGSNRDVTPRFVVFGRQSDVAGPLPGPTPPPGAPVVSPPVAPAPAAPGPSVVQDDVTQPFTDVNSLPTVDAQTSAAIKAACMAEGMRALPAAVAAVVPLRLVTKPGKERWPVKTAADRDVALVGKNVIDGEKLATGIVDTTVEELVRIPRPADMLPVGDLFPKYQDRRRAPVEFTVWRLECEVIGVKLEADGDLHIVVRGASGRTMIGETPTARVPFVEARCPWLQNLRDARQAVESRLVAQLRPQDFIQLDNTLVPRASVVDAPLQPLALERLPTSFNMPDGDDVAVPTFEAAVKPTRARVTGVGFFDRVHSQTGVSQLNGIELHPILKIEWL